MEKETYLIFVLDNDWFAVKVANVLEVLEQQQISRVPKAPEGILGITNFRGQILPVVNTRYKFNMDSGELSEKYYVIVYEIHREERQFVVSATADGVKDVIEIDTAEINPVPDMGLNYDARFLSGVVTRNDRFILIIKPELLFSLKDTEVE
jgi:purine-binding chemotaxis protein CheW